MFEANVCIGLLVCLQAQFLHPFSQQLLTALQLVDAYIHITDGGDTVLPRLAKFNNLEREAREITNTGHHFK